MNTKTVRYSLLVVTVVAIASVVIAAEEKEKAGASVGITTANQHQVIDPANIVWGEQPPGLPPGAKAAVLSGDPGKKGSFTVRLRMPAGYKIMPHTHPTAENITVLSGTFHLGTGDKFDESAGHTMGAGGFMAMPAGMKHFAWATEESTIQVHAEGPFKIVYVNPSDDPRTAKK
ncbi:MAG TPA: cupin domain-containing protein [Chthoniobacterales bacterium]|nr:cupin domain-containing protein [Chthoniobacterales bacterium]